MTYNNSDKSSDDAKRGASGEGERKDAGRSDKTSHEGGSGEAGRRDSGEGKSDSSGAASR